MIRGRLFKRGEYVPDRVGLADNLNWEPYAKCALDAQDELGSPKAVDAEIAVELAGQGNIDASFGLLLQFLHQFAHDGNESALAPCLILSHSRRIISVVPPSWLAASGMLDAGERRNLVEHFDQSLPISNSSQEEPSMERPSSKKSPSSGMPRR